jgi:hypothetical protein
MKGTSGESHFTTLHAFTEFGQLHHLSGFFGDAYQLLQARLSILQKMIDNPEVYF